MDDPALVDAIVVVVVVVCQTNNEIRETDRAIQLVQRSIIEKEEGLKVAQTRLDERTRRRCVEICRDAPMHGSVV